MTELLCRQIRNLLHTIVSGVREAGPGDEPVNIQWLVELMRNRESDKARALRAVREIVRSEAREAMAEYDAFVEPAKTVRDGLLLGTASSSSGEEIPIRLPWGAEHHHWLVEGGTGVGKSTWIAAILREELRRGRAAGVIDMKGDLFAAGIRWLAALAQRLPKHEQRSLRERLLVVNPFSDHLVPLNICRAIPGCPPEAWAYEITLAVSRMFDSSLGFHMESLLRHVILLLMEAQLSLAEAPMVLEDEALRGVLAARSANPMVKNFFLGTYPVVPQVSKDALLSRLQGLLLPENLRLMLGAEELIDLRDRLESSAPIFVFLGKGLGVPEEQVEVLGSLLIQLIFQATYARGSGGRAPYLLALDEFTHILEAPALARRFETALTSARSYGLSLMLIHHAVAQLPPTLREIILANTDYVALFRTSERNAAFFGDFVPDVDPEGSRDPGNAPRRRGLERVARLPDRHVYWYDRRKPHRAIRLRVPDEPSPHEFAGISRSSLDELIRVEGWDRGGAALPRSVLRQQIETRQKRLAALIRPPINLSRREPTDSQPTVPSKKRRPKLG